MRQGGKKFRRSWTNRGKADYSFSTENERDRDARNTKCYRPQKRYVSPLPSPLLSLTMYSFVVTCAGWDMDPLVVISFGKKIFAHII